MFTIVINKDGREEEVIPAKGVAIFTLKDKTKDFEQGDGFVDNMSLHHIALALGTVVASRALDAAVREEVDAEKMLFSILSEVIKDITGNALGTLEEMTGGSIGDMVDEMVNDLLS